MKFSILNPLLTGLCAYRPYEDCHELLFNCPLCRQRIVIYVHYLKGEKDKEKHIWKLKLNIPPNAAKTDNIWDYATLEDSIQDHPVSRKSSACPAHFSIKDGNIIFH